MLVSRSPFSSRGRERAYGVREFDPRINNIRHDPTPRTVIINISCAPRSSMTYPPQPRRSTCLAHQRTRLDHRISLYIRDLRRAFNLQNHTILCLQAHAPPPRHRERIHLAAQYLPFFAPRYEIAFPEGGHDGCLVSFNGRVGGVVIVDYDVAIGNDVFGIFV
jgi:hypothetical protein